ncbi:hypothetical protein NMY22_g14645 [Coprinellus aureogranulatus]|nr:hypothetical protein NMY22_g14645 [Coprinellus aureogranulatus]
MSSPTKRSYASVVAGVKVSDLIEPQVPGPQSLQDASPLSAVDPATPVTASQIEKPSANLSPALPAMSCVMRHRHSFRPSVQNYAIQYGSEGVRPLTPESIPDRYADLLDPFATAADAICLQRFSGAIFDPDDSSYRGRVVNSLVGDPDAVSVIKTRAARAAEGHKSLLPTSTSPTQPILKGHGSLSTSLPTQPMSARPKSHRGRGKQSSSRGKATARRQVTKGSESANQAEPPTADVMDDPEDMPVVPSSKRRRQVPAVTPGPHADCGEELPDSADSVSRKRLRTDRPQSPLVLATDHEGGEVPDIEMVGNTAFLGLEGHGLPDEDDEGYSSDPGSLKDFIVDDDAPFAVHPSSVSATTIGDDTQPQSSDNLMKGERVDSDAAMDAYAHANAPLVATEVSTLEVGPEPNSVVKSDRE